MLELESGTQSQLQSRSSAEIQSASNWRRNLLALRQTQEELAQSLVNAKLDVQWVFARDGALTAFENGKWWGGCSVPAKAAEELLRTLQITTSLACFLAPAHPAQLAFALRRLKAEQAIIALLPRFEDLILSLHCHDFSDDIIAHRLWFVGGDTWPAQLSELLRHNPGLPIPQQFVRTPLLSDDASAPLIAVAQRIFADELSHRSQRLSKLRETRLQSTSNDRPHITLAAPMGFRLWDDCGGILQQLVASDSDFDWQIVNFDDPHSASPLALAQAAAKSDAVITANLPRADCGNFLHPQIPLISWLTTRAIPSFDTAGPRDALLLCDSRMMEIAQKFRWPADRIALAAWPSIAHSASPQHLSIIADTRPIPQIPGFDLSSHQLLWDLIRSELADDPTRISGDVPAYLRSRMNHLAVADHGLDHRRFIEELIVPCYQQALAAQLLKSNLPLRIFGEGWRQIPQFANHAAGPINSREQLKSAIQISAALVHLWPINHVHPIDAAGPPVIRLSPRGLAAFVADARLAPATGLKPARPVTDSIDMVSIARTLRAAIGQ